MLRAAVISGCGLLAAWDKDAQFKPTVMGGDGRGAAILGGGVLDTLDAEAVVAHVLLGCDGQAVGKV